MIATTHSPLRWVAVAGLTALAVLRGCDEGSSGDGAGGRPDAAGGSAGVAGTGATGGADGSGGSAAAVGSGAAGNAGSAGSAGVAGTAGTSSDAGNVWVPDGDPEWTQVDWMSCPGVMRAKVPANAVPTYPVRACAGMPGCTYADFGAFAPPHQGQSSGNADVATIKQGGTLTRTIDFGDERSAIYEFDEARAVPRDAFKSTGSRCVIHYHQVSANSSCLVVVEPLVTARAARFTRGPTPTAPFNVFDPLSAGTQTCGDRLWIASFAGYARDFQDNQDISLAPLLGAGRSITAGLSVDDVILLVARAPGPTHELWAWSKARGPVRVYTTTMRILTPAFDGAQVAWTERLDVSTGTATAEVMWGAFAYSADSVRATRLATVRDGDFIGFGRIGGGYYAFGIGSIGIFDVPRETYVWRLSDGRRWTVPSFEDPNADGTRRAYPIHLARVDAEELIYLSIAGQRDPKSHLVRQRLDALGPGEL
jgi:hypothetical protein